MKRLEAAPDCHAVRRGEGAASPISVVLAAVALRPGVSWPSHCRSTPELDQRASQAFWP